MIKLLQFGLEGLLALVVLIFAYTQFVRPLIMGTPVFPIFRKRPNFERQMEDVTETARDQAQKRALDRKKKKLGIADEAGPAEKSV